ncbi:hypothetical protein VTL71DRAFT_8161 [Oculimacula yallundae]|uniref:Uncharacterized protein n=1 Tax=Oculimacula yallundae TaxID=86028 RepID=A0ABR4CX42_9HELO
MAPLSSLSDANGRTLKRPFTAVTITTPPSPKRTSTSSTIGFQSKKIGHRVEAISAKASDLDLGGRRTSFFPIMPSAAGPRIYRKLRFGVPSEAIQQHSTHYETVDITATNRRDPRHTDTLAPTYGEHINTSI